MPAMRLQNKGEIMKTSYIVRLNGKGKGSIEYLDVCESCESNPKRTPESKWCESCVEEIKGGE
jgi:rRNA maturation endonuclease Nob1